MTLRDLNIGQTARILRVGGEGALRQHMLDMGVIPGTTLRVQKFAPMGDPVQLLIHGYELTIRLSDAQNIDIVNTPVVFAWEKFKINRIVFIFADDFGF